MKVACIGNMNNNMFATVRHLRDAGVDATLFLLRGEHEHFHPSADTFDRSYQAYTHRLDWGTWDSFPETHDREVLAPLEGYDLIVACGLAPAFLGRAGRRVDLFMPYGSDLNVVPFWEWKADKYNSVCHEIGRQQARAIRECGRAVLDHSGYYRPWYERLGALDRTEQLGLLMVYTPQYNSKRMRELAGRTHWHHEFARLRREHDFVVLHPTRHTWKTRPDGANKGNDVLLRGFAAFVQGRPDLQPCLALLEYGADVEASRRLVYELGIGDRVQWFPQMLRKDIMAGILEADIVANHFGNSGLGGGVVLEALALGRVVMACRRDEEHQGVYPRLYEMLRACDVDSVRARLEDFAADPDHWRYVGLQGLEWYHTFCVERTLHSYLRVLRELENVRIQYF